MKKIPPQYKATIDLRRPETHRALVTLEATKARSLPLLLTFPVWTPGSYMVRDYSRHVTRLEGGRKVAKNQWQLPCGTRRTSWEVYCFEPTVRTSFADARMISLNGATLLPLLQSSPFEVELLLPKSWKMVASALGFRRAGPGRWNAVVVDEDHWIDSPVIACAPGYGGSVTVTARGIRHHVAWVGSQCTRPLPEIAHDFRKLAEATIRMFGGAPFREYWQLLHLDEGFYGGLERRCSNLSQFDGGKLHIQKDYENFLRLLAHEYFHSWNVKSLRPEALGPFDYTRENYTEELWFAEGLTDYFDELIPVRAGLAKEEKFHEAQLKSQERQLDGLPAHRRRSLAEGSFDTWIRHYRPDEDSDNTDVCYYRKGAVLGWCWDAHLRKHSRGRWSLEKLLRAAWKKFGVDAYVPLRDARKGYTREEILSWAEGKTGVKQAALVEAWVTGRKPLPWREAAKFFRVKPKEKIADLFLHLAGAKLEWKSGMAAIGKVISESAAEAAGLSPKDELIAVNGWRIREGEDFLKARLSVGRDAELLLQRAGKVFTAKIRPRRHQNLGVSYT
ncbi:MAG: M61 family metallopeptidase [Bdellovibrionales bacterium]|nr:M61 family metallopeptidase [Bdellovibrionales bacterium]